MTLPAHGWPIVALTAAALWAGAYVANLMHIAHM
jgi:hypothetical protein